MNRLATNVLSSLLFLVILSSSVFASCVATDLGDDSPEIAKAKTDYAIAVITDSEYLSKEPSCVAANMRYLGLTHVTRAVPLLISLLTYRVQNGLISRGIPLVYPAVSALRNIGEPALPALVEVLAWKDNDTLESRNALDTFMDVNVHRDDHNLGVRRLKQAAAKEHDPMRAMHLDRAVQDARNRWCPAPCTE